MLLCAPPPRVRQGLLQRPAFQPLLSTWPLFPVGSVGITGCPQAADPHLPLALHPVYKFSACLAPLCKHRACLLLCACL